MDFFDDTCVKGTTNVKLDQDAEYDSYKQIDERLQSVQRQVRIARLIVSNVDQSQTDALIYVYRGWRILVNTKKSFSEEKQDLGAVESNGLTNSLEHLSVNRTSPLSRDEWLSDLQYIEETVLPEWNDGEITDQHHNQRFDTQKIRSHIRTLEKTVSSSLEQYRQEFGRETFAVWLTKLLVLLACIGGVTYGILTLAKTPRNWQALIYRNKTLAGTPTFMTRYQKINFDWTDRGPLKGASDNTYSLRLNSKLRLKKSREIEFVLGSDDGSRLFLNGRKILDLWQTNDYQETRKTLSLSKGTYRLRVEYFQNDGPARLQLKAGFDGEQPKILEGKRLSLPEDQPFETTQDHSS